MSEHDQYRVVGQNHHVDGEPVPEGKVLDAEQIPDGILRNFPTKFEPVEGSDAESESASDEDVEDGPATDEVPDSAAEDTSADLDAEEAIEEIADESDVEVDVNEDSGYTRAELEDMSRTERVQVAKESDHPDIDGRSSDDDIIAALTDSDE